MYQSFQTQQVQLPYPHNQLLLQPVYYQPGQLPFQVQVQTEPQLMPYVPLMGTAAIEAIQAKHADNALRVFMYNQMSVNGYNNMAFHSLVKSIARYTEMMMYRQAYPRIQDAIYDGAAKLAELYCADNLRTVPGLMNVLDPNLLARSQNALNMVQAYEQEVNQYLQMRQQQQGGFQQPAQHGYVQQNINYAPPVQQNSFFQQPGTNIYSQPAGGNSSLFSQGSPSQFQNAPPASPQTTWLTKENAPVQQAQQVQQNTSPSSNLWNTTQQTSSLPFSATQQQVVKEEPVASGPEFPPDVKAILDAGGRFVKASDPGVKWVPSAKYPFTIAYNYRKYDLYYLIEASGIMRPYLMPLTKEQLMNRDQHFKPSFCPSHLIMDSAANSAKRLADIEECIANGNGIRSREQDLQDIKDLAKLNNTELELDVVSEKDLRIVANSDNEVWKEAEFNLLSQKTKEKTVPAFSTGAYVADALVSKIDPKQSADRLLESGNFVNAVSTLKDIKACATTGNTTFGDLITVNYLNSRLTERLRRYINLELALDIKFSSFMDDAVDLLEFIEKKYGENFSNPLRMAQGKIISDSVTYATGEIEASLLGGYGGREEGVSPCVTFFICEDVFVTLNVFSSDINFEFPLPGVSVAIFEEDSKLISMVAKHIFDSKIDVFNRHLVRTLDRITFEINRSVIDKNTFMISMV